MAQIYSLYYGNFLKYDFNIRHYQLYYHMFNMIKMARIVAIPV